MNKLSYLHTPRRQPYKYISVVDVFRSYARASPNKEIIIHHDPDGWRKALTYDELEKKSTLLGKYLVQNGIKAGDFIGIMGPNTLEWMIGEMGILMSGAVAIHLTPDEVNNKRDVEIVMKNSCRVVLVDPGRQGELKNPVLSFVEKMKEKDPDISILYLRKDFHESGLSLDDTFSLETASAVLPNILPEENAIVFITSRSTGQPKYVPWSHFVVVNSGFLSINCEDKPLESIFYNDRPFSWILGNPLLTIMLDCPRVFTDARRAIQGDNTRLLWEIMIEERCTQALILPYMIKDMLCEKDDILKDDNFKLKVICTGGQVVDKSLFNVVGLFCEKFAIIYGSTEVSMAFLGDHYHPSISMESGNVGKPLPGFEVRIVEKNNRVLKVGEIGEIQIRTRIKCSSYLHNIEATNASYQPDDWYSMGDIGYIGADDFLHVIGRSKDVISRGTRNIMPGGIESVIQAMDGIKSVVVVGVPDDRLFEEVCVCFVSDTSLSVGVEDVNMFARAHYPRESTLDGLGDMPKYFLQFDTFPLLSNGKHDRPSIKLLAAEKLNLS